MLEDIAILNVYISKLSNFQISKFLITVINNNYKTYRFDNINSQSRF